MSQTLAILILGLPAAGALLLALFGGRTRLLPILIGPGVVWLAFICVVWLLLAGQSFDYTYWTWLSFGSGKGSPVFNLPFNLLIDHLSLFMGLVVTGVGGLIVTYSVGYMSHENDTSFARFFCYLDLFLFSMLMLVLAGNFIFLIIGWGMVGLSSYLLIGFWYQRPSAVLAARKAFVMNVIGDVGMILGTFLLFVSFGHQTTFAGVFAAIPHTDNSTLEVAAFLLLVGAVAKSAQLPLHTWLPDAMEGPTPVSALIHAATMVTAGVYLVARMHPIYDTASTAHHAVAIIGALTSLFAASIAFVQTDIKRVLAYSTMSQIGYMFLAVGVGAYSAALFHLVAHAFFKALLFMAAGNVIHASHDEQDMRKFSGLWDHMKGTSWCFLIGSLSLVGTIPLVGFFSKDLILDQALSKPGDPIATLVWGIGLATALMTGFYTGRMWYLSFWKRPGMPATEHKPHEAPWVMLGPVIVLTVLTVIGGWVLQGTALNESLSNVLTAYLEPVVGKLPWGPLPYGWVIALGTTAAGTGLFGFAYLFYGRESLDATKVRHRLSWLHTLLEKKYYFDEFYDLIFVRGMDAFAKLLRTGVETPLIDGTVSGTARTLEGAAGQLSLVQNGYFRSYALAFLGGVVVVAVIVVVSIH